MIRLLTLAVAVILLSGCPQPPAPQNGADDTEQNGTEEKNGGEKQNGDQKPPEQEPEHDKPKTSLREQHEDEITTTIGRAILDVLDETEEGSDEKRAEIIRTLKKNNDALWRARGSRARELILRNNNPRRRTLYVPPPPE